MVVHDDPNAIALVHLNLGRSAAVVTQSVQPPAGKISCLTARRQMEFLNAPSMRHGSCGTVRRFHRNDLIAPLGSMVHVAHVLHVHARPVCLRWGVQQRGTAANPAPNQRYFFRKSTSVLIALPLQDLATQLSPKKLNGH